ncbi:MAG: glycosyl hydrolase [Betaproteobacteria bacterium HGW-Betaproteobacteria-11]|nr:MAG: glycosyl hydrolase [Betaproteobacteria bacterium HGW-Betaproteobacteria-11]
MPLTLLFGVHAHQPVGNFPAVIDTAHARCYGMFLRVMERYPEFRFSVHFSGWLLDYLLTHFPADMTRLAAMTRRGQVEWFGSGDCEPVLAAIPQRDRVTQITTLTEKIERHFGVRPTGAWLTERVWESSVVPALSATGIRYVAVDDYHFLCAGVDGEKLDSFYTTEEDGLRLDLFPIAEAARYRLPFSPAADAVGWLEELARQGRRAAIYFDDIEKFGIWPETYDWVYVKGWLTQFVEGVLASPLIRTATFADYHAREKTRGIVYLPTTSYIEMNEWTLPAPRAAEYRTLLDAEKAAGRFETDKPFLRGGIWRNFMSRYPEANWMHKRMLEVSQRLARLPAARRTPQMQENLHRAQANDAYWHGLFGGLYLPHLRRAVWHNLLTLEAALERLHPSPALECRDLDDDGHDELLLRSQALLAIIRVDGDAALAEFSSLALAHNFGDTLRQHAEIYHAKVGAGETAALAGKNGIASAHERIAFLHPITAADAEPDRRPRGSGLDNWLTTDGARLALDAYRPDGPPGHFVARGEGWRVEKCYALHDDVLEIAYRFIGAECPGRLETQLNLALPSCDGYGGRYVLADGRIPCGFGQVLELPALTQLTLEDSELGATSNGALRLSVPPVAGSAAPTLVARPHHTVSQSEAGFEKVMQAICLTLTWPAMTGDWHRLMLKVVTAS